MKQLLLLSTFLIGCYEPVLETCAIACGANDPCPAGLTCGSDFHCHAPDDLTTCEFEVRVELTGELGLLGSATLDAGPIACAGGTCTASVAGGTELVFGVNLEELEDAPLLIYAGDCTGRVCKPIVDRDLVIHADVSAGRRIEIGIEGDGNGIISSSPDGIACPGRCIGVFSPTEDVTLTATPIAPSVFRGWTNVPWCGRSLECMIAGSAATTDLRPNFDVNKLVLTPFGANTLGNIIEVRHLDTPDNAPPDWTCPPDCVLRFFPDDPTPLKLNAVPANDDTRFVRWIGLTCVAAADGTCNIVLPIESDHVGIAEFELKPLVTVDVISNGQPISVTMLPSGFQCTSMVFDQSTKCQKHVDVQTTVSISVTPVNTAFETLWTGCPTLAPNEPSQPSCNFPMPDVNATLVATVTPLPTLTVTAKSASLSVLAEGVPQLGVLPNSFRTYRFPAFTEIEVLHGGPPPSGDVWEDCPSTDLTKNPCKFDLRVDPEAVVAK